MPCGKLIEAKGAFLPTWAGARFTRLVLGLVAGSVLAGSGLAAELQRFRPADDSPARPGSAVAAAAAPTEVPALTAQIDRMLDEQLAAEKVRPSRLISDEEFIRRVSLDVTGKLPSPEQVRAFVRRTGAQKRARLIDELLQSPAYAANWANYWRDVIRFPALPNQNKRRVDYDRLRGWLDQQFRRNTPWDRIVTELITARGSNRENPAVNFVLAEEAKPEVLAAETARIFMGIQIQCAQCHDHKTDRWKREQFHELAAFFGKLRAQPVGGRKAKGMQGFEVVSRPGEYRMTTKKDPRKSVIVQPRFFLTEAPLPRGLDDDRRRAILARLITGPDDPWFARALINRTWAKLMGSGFVEPIDNMGPDHEDEVAFPEVLDALAHAWTEHGDDVQWLLRVMLNTRAYQREVRPRPAPDSAARFAAVCPTRLSGDQIAEALSSIFNLDRLLGGAAGMARGPRPGAGILARRAQALKPAARAGGKAAAIRTQIAKEFAVDPSMPADEVQQTVPQALLLMNNPGLNRAIVAQRGTVLAEVMARAHSNPTEVITQIYLKVLARRPTRRELATCRAYLAQVRKPAEAYEDILWSLINSAEFVTKR